MGHWVLPSCKIRYMAADAAGRSFLEFRNFRNFWANFPSAIATATLKTTRVAIPRYPRLLILVVFPRECRHQRSRRRWRINLNLWDLIWQRRLVYLQTFVQWGFAKVCGGYCWESRGSLSATKGPIVYFHWRLPMISASYCNAKRLWQGNFFSVRTQ